MPDTFHIADGKCGFQPLRVIRKPQPQPRTASTSSSVSGGSRRGMSLVELIVAFTILLALTSMAVPLARSRVQPSERAPVA